MRNRYLTKSKMISSPQSLLNFLVNVVLPHPGLPSSSNILLSGVTLLKRSWYEMVTFVSTTSSTDPWIVLRKNSSLSMFAVSLMRARLT